MELEQASGERLEFVHEGEPFLRHASWFLGACVLSVLWLAWGSWASIALVLAVAAFFLWLLARTTADSRAVFDRAAGHLQLTHSRQGRPLATERVELAAIERVIVDVATGAARSGDGLALRPALWVEGRVVPLTWREFGAGEEPMEIARSIRAFLGLPDGDLIDDSLEVLARQPRIQPAVRLARIGKGLGRLEALQHVRRLQAAGS